MSLIHKRSAPIRSADWWNSSYDHRIHVGITNSSGAALQDHLVAYDTSGVTPAVTIDTNSLRVVEKTAIQGIDRAWDWRYANECNRLLTLPVKKSGSTVTFKALGNWLANETRYFDLYWNQAGGIAAPSFAHLDAIGNPWTVVLTLGSTGNSYVLVIGGTTYTYVQASGDTTATILGTNIIALINAGTVATATNASGTLSITTTTPRVYSFTVANTGSTTPANLVITAPLYFSVGRVGPETSNAASFPNPATNANYKFNLGLGVTAQANAASLLGIGKNPNTDGLLRMLRYNVNLDAGNYFTSAGVITSVSVDGPTVTVTGTYSTTATGTNPNLWTAAWTAVFSHKMVAGALSSNNTPASGPFPKTKPVIVCRFTCVWTCRVGYAPSDVASGNTASNFQVLSYADSIANFSGNVTAVSPNTTPNFYALAGAGPTAYVASADLSALPVTGTVLGSAGNSHAGGIIVHSLTTGNGFPGAPVLHWRADASAFAYLNWTAVSHTTTTIPTGATISVDLTMVNGFTPSATTAADELLPNEVVTLLQNINYVPTFSPSVETYSLATLKQTIINMSNRLTNGVAWFQNPTNTPGNKVNNYSFAYNPKTAVFGFPDDDDGNYSEGYKLAGLVLRRLRTGDPATTALIENQVGWHLDIEGEAVRQYGSWWKGSAPYWYSPLAAQSRLYEGGFQQPGAVLAQMDPNAGITYGTLTDPVTQNQPVTGGSWKNTWSSGTQYHSLDWVAYTDTAGAYSGVIMWYQVNSGATPTIAVPPTDGSGNLNTGWGNRVCRQYSMSYGLNQVRASTSNDQIAMVGWGLYHFYQLLAADPTLGNVALPNSWRVGDLVLGSTGDSYTVNIAGTACTYVQLGGDTIYTVATGLAAAITAAAIAGVSAFATNAVVRLTGVLGKTITNTGSTTPANVPLQTLRAAVLNYVKRMADFQCTTNPNGNTGATKNLLSVAGTPQLYNLLSGTSTYTPTANGISTGVFNYAAGSALAISTYNGGTVYSGSTFGAWETSQGSGGVLASDANSGFADLIRSIYAPATPNGATADQAAIIFYLSGRASDITCLDLGRHAWAWNAAVSTRGSLSQIPSDYPGGWNMRSADPGNTYQSGVNANAQGPYATDAHWQGLNGGTLDSANGRGFQRMALLAMLALFNPVATCLVEMDGTASPSANVVRSVAITTLLDDMARTFSLYFIEPTTSAVRTCANGALGTGSFSPWAAMSTFTGYGLFAVELYLLVQARINNGLASNPLGIYYKYPGI